MKHSKTMRALTLPVRLDGLVAFRRWRAPAAVTTRAFSSFPPTIASSEQSRGGLPRFYSPVLPSAKGSVVHVQDDEFWHMVKVLRLGVNDRLELFNGAGSVIAGCIQKIHRTGLEILAMENPKVIAPNRVQWHVMAAFGTLKGGRADWLIEKCTELGASSVTPILTERSPTIPENRVERLQRVSLAATKQCQRLHGMTMHLPLKIPDLLPQISQSRVALLAAAGTSPLIETISSSDVGHGGLLVVGPEGDFTEEEVKMVTDAGATPISLGPCRLRVETAAIALLSTMMLWSDSSRC